MRAYVNLLVILIEEMIFINVAIVLETKQSGTEQNLFSYPLRRCALDVSKNQYLRLYRVIYLAQVYLMLHSKTKTRSVC